MKIHRVSIDSTKSSTFPVGRIDTQRFDNTTEQEIACQQEIDNDASILDAARFARRVRKKLGLTQLEFSMRIDVSLETIRNWEQGKRCPTGAAKTLLKLLYRAPEAALSALK